MNVPKRLPESIKSACCGYLARIRRIKGSDRYYVDFYTIEKDGSTRYSTNSPPSTRTFTKADAYREARWWAPGKSA